MASRAIAVQAIMLQQTDLATPVRRHLLIGAIIQHRQLLHACLLRQMAVRRAASCHSYCRTLLTALVLHPLRLTFSSGSFVCSQALMFGQLPGWRRATAGMLRKMLMRSSSAFILLMPVLKLYAMRVLSVVKSRSWNWNGHLLHTSQKSPLLRR